MKITHFTTFLTDFFENIVSLSDLIWNNSYGIINIKYKLYIKQNCLDMTFFCGE